MNALVVGFGSSGQAITRWLRDRGDAVTVVDDHPTDALRRAAAELGIDIVEHPDEATLDRIVVGADVVVPSPGVPIRHPVFAAAERHDIPLRGDIELVATTFTQPVVAVTGTNGKTTVTALVAEMLAASGLSAVTAGNIGVPVADAVTTDADVVVIEVSSFQLQLTERFQPRVGVWLNFAEDHLDWHPDLESYAAAKFRVWAAQSPDDLAVANADDADVMRWAAKAPSRVVTFGLGEADWRLAGDVLIAPDGERILDRTDLVRGLPHDVANALAASAAASGAGATLDGVRAALRSFARFPHRVALVGDSGGVRWYDDSKATNPHAALSAIRGFPSVVLIAGGRNKGLDLTPLAAAAGHVRAVVALGEAASEVERAFDGVRPVRPARTMDDAVRVAAGLAEPGDVVLLSPACASFDAYTSYAERGDDFAQLVRQHLGQTEAVS